MTMSSGYVVETMTRSSRWALLVLFIVLCALLALPFWGRATDMRILIEFFYYLALAQTWNLLAGYAGLVSVGQQAFVGLGSYAFISATIFFGIPPLVAIPVAGIVAAIVAVPSAFLLFRLQGAYFAIGTWALAEIFRLFFTQVKFFGSGTGLSLPIAIIRDIAADRSTRDLVVYYIAMGIGLGSIVFVFIWLRSRVGMALTAIRDSATAAASIGINQRQIKLIVYVVAAAITGMVGALIILQKLRITPGAGFSVLDWSANIIFIVVIGGIGSIEGPIIGAIIYFTLRAMLADYGSWYLIVLGAVAVAVMIKAPTGVWGYISERFDFHIFPVRRHVRLIDDAPRRIETKGIQ